MNLEKLKPWNWFKHEENSNAVSQVPVTRSEGGSIDDPLMNIHREMDRLFERFSSAVGMSAPGADSGSFWRGNRSLAGAYRPQIDVSGDDNCYEIKLDVPGMTEKELSLQVKDDMLVIRGEKQSQSENKDRHYYRVERSYGAFQRTLSLPDDANADEIEARLDNGVLRLEIPRRESVGHDDVKRIPIMS